jgi:hypothetical protein
MLCPLQDIVCNFILIFIYFNFFNPDHYCVRTDYPLVNIYFLNTNINGNYLVSSNPSFTWRLGRYGEEGGDSQSSSARYWIDIHPEGDPWDDNKENGWQVTLYQVEPHRTTQMELRYQTAVITWNKICSSQNYVCLNNYHCLKLKTT